MPNPLDDQLSRWRGAGLLTPSQAEAIRAYEELRADPSPPPAPAEPPEPRISLDVPPEAPPSTPVIPGYQAPGPAPKVPSLTLPIRRFELDARVLGGLLAALALLAMVGAVFALATDVVVAPSHRWGTDAEDVAHAVAAALGLTGGLRMAGGRYDGKRLVYVSLGLNLAATLLFSIAHIFEVMTLLPVLVWLVLGWLTWSSRFGEPVVATRSQVS